MTAAMPEGWHSVTSRLIVDDTASLVDFLRRAFGAAGEHRTGAPSEIRIGDTLVMVSSTLERPATRSCFYVYVADADETYRRAIDAGAGSIEPPRDTPYGDRRAMVEDPAGNIWQIATRRES